MRTIGFYLLLMGLSSFIVMAFNTEFRVFSWMDQWGSLSGIAIRLGIIFVGIIFASLKPKRIEDRYPELREIHELELKKEHSNTADSKTGV
jgi:hypothetical protein